MFADGWNMLARTEANCGCGAPRPPIVGLSSIGIHTNIIIIIIVIIIIYHKSQTGFFPVSRIYTFEVDFIPDGLLDVFKAQESVHASSMLNCSDPLKRNEKIV